MFVNFRKDVFNNPGKKHNKVQETEEYEINLRLQALTNAYSFSRLPRTNVLTVFRNEA